MASRSVAFGVKRLGDFGNFQSIVTLDVSMLELAYVRENLPQIEEMLRRRGMDPERVLGGFRAVDDRRRKLITQPETLKAHRNRASEEIARLTKPAHDATPQTTQPKPCP